MIRPPQHGLPKDAFKSLTPLGSGVFKKVETGKVDAFTLALDETAHNELHKVIKGGVRPAHRRSHLRMTTSPPLTLAPAMRQRQTGRVSSVVQVR